ncbi:MAG: DNA-deoxyinosine glycosylase [Oscillospiraceae bacterium]|nr:DNA-deoxyinosine glycosylase [Oscillospiraceae bacterium]
MTLNHGFAPVFDERSRLLILGSFPSVKSREEQFYYAHPRNRFWPVLAAVFDSEVPRTVEEKTAFLHRFGIALYDVIESCSIVGSSDSSIADVVPADLSAIVSGTEIGDRIFTNGATAFRLYRRYCYPSLGLQATLLPSSSPANAAWSLTALTERWTSLLAPAIERSC